LTLWVGDLPATIDKLKSTSFGECDHALFEAGWGLGVCGLHDRGAAALNSTCGLRCRETSCEQIDDDAEAAQARPFTNNPRGDLGKTIPAAERDPLVAEFRAALELDAEEKDIAVAIYAIHDRIKSNHDLYVAVSDCLNSKERSALKAYIKMAQEKK
jgi:hypothetical protein